MTYCVGILVDAGMVMVADTRTNAGVDNIATFRKLRLFENKGERVIALATSGNLSISQSVLSILDEGVACPETARSKPSRRYPPCSTQPSWWAGRFAPPITSTARP